MLALVGVIRSGVDYVSKCYNVQSDTNRIMPGASRRQWLHLQGGPMNVPDYSKICQVGVHVGSVLREAVSSSA